MFMEEGRYDEYPSTQDSYYEDERMDTLSLSDLLIDTQDFYRIDDPNPNLDIDEEFEFSSELLKTSTSMGTKAVKDNKISGSNNGGIGSWRLVRFLGCGGSKGGDNHHPNTIVKIERVK
ncbi:hypothetical protein L2E82_32377 [Cichorium intybus]|uniref:Uncharacterized protein n=1 Tax=Cichorium intybus TaxID=13427 RepID=A0ACB9BG53_CICIN|nr:hypothetical protein L2E82_32377 [Cichorium intybus]